MEVRDAVESDADALADCAGLPSSAVSQLVHDRTVCVAVEGTGTGSDAEADDDSDADGGGGADDAGGDSDAGGGDSDAGGGLDDGGEVVGFVAFDAVADAVHVTQLAGDRDAVARLLDEPARFADREGMPVEVLVPESEADVSAAVEAYGFEDVGEGPRFAGEATRRYRLDR